MAAARVHLHIPTVDPEAANAALGIHRMYVKEMEADHRAGTAAPGPCQPLKAVLWPACLERFQLEKIVALVHQQCIIFTNKDKLYESNSPKAELFYQLQNTQ